jgi:polyhydroxyalkanoate synthesis regulator phasin
VHDYVNNVKDKKEEYTLCGSPMGFKKIRKKEIKEITVSPSNRVDEGEIKVDGQKKTYRKVKEFIKTTEEQLETKLKEDSQRVQKELDQIVYDNFDVSYKENIDEIEKLFSQVENTRNYSVNLLSMQKIRKKLLGKISLDEYIQLLSTHTKRLYDIFITKKYTPQKITKIISKSFTHLDMRLIHYEGYIDMSIELDDVQKFSLALNILTGHKNLFVPYDKQIFYNNMRNYSISLFELKDCIERCLVNIYGFHNVIFLPKNKVDPKGEIHVSDPYSFYTLEKVNDKRCWKMECRLEDFTNDFIDNILPYCITLFRKIYKDVFSDNTFREDYTLKANILEFDCEQLMLNIILLSKPIAMCRLFQEIIIKKCVITLTEIDKFNLYGDDKMQQKRFDGIQDKHGNTIEIIKKIFDNISSEQAEIFCSKKV